MGFDWRKRLEYVNGQIGDYLRTFQGPRIPIRMLLRLITAESKRDGLSEDFVLCEVGWASVPLAVAWRHNVDPFDDLSASWLAVHEAESDSAHYLELFPGLFRTNPWPGDLEWAVLLDYSIGTRAAEFVIRTSLTYGHQGMTLGVQAKSLRDWACEWVRKGIHDETRERRYYGRQTCAQVYARIAKDAGRVVEIFALRDSLEGTPHATVERPEGLATFPASKELRKAAKICNRTATPEEHLSAWRMVRRYIDRRFGNG